MKKVLPLLISIVLAPSALAENLIQVYEQARLTNPDLKSSIADKEKAYSAISEQRASLLPQLGLNASYGLTHGFLIMLIGKSLILLNSKRVLPILHINQKNKR